MARDRPAPGTPPQRTALAAQRTSLAVVVASLVQARLTLDELGGLALVAPALVLVLVGTGLVADRRLTEPSAAGVRTAALTAGIVGLCLVELLVVVH